jgi:hypothetical protein
MGENVLGEHRAQGQHLVRVRTHHRRDDARAQNPGQPGRRVGLQHAQQDAVGIGNFAQRGKAEHAEKHARQPDGQDGQG